MTENDRDSRAVLGAVLAGGSSRRMGCDKALLLLEGRPLLARAVEVLGSVLDEVVVVAPPDRGYETLDVEIIRDIYPDQGPVGGIHTALVHAGGRPVFVLACDMQMVSRELILWLLDAGHADSVMGARTRRLGAQVRLLRDSEGLQPLCGLYSGNCLPVVERALEDQQRSALTLVEALEKEVLPLDSNQSWYRPDLLVNINNMDAYRGLATGRG